MRGDMKLSKPIIKAASACVWRGDEVLLAQRGKTWGYGYWSLPGGKIEAGETAQQAAERELLEETGVRADLAWHVGDFDLDGGKVHYVISCFTGAYVSGDARAMTDAMAVAWVHWQKLSDYKLAVNNTDAVLRARRITSI
jgi:8-oxo-dGTP diphosphatase